MDIRPEFQEIVDTLLYDYDWKQDDILRFHAIIVEELMRKGTHYFTAFNRTEFTFTDSEIIDSICKKKNSKKKERK